MQAVCDMYECHIEGVSQCTQHIQWSESAHVVMAHDITRDAGKQCNK